MPYMGEFAADWLVRILENKVKFMEAKVAFKASCFEYCCSLTDAWKCSGSC